MPRLARVVAKGVVHHITQRGNARRTVFDSDADRLVYLDLLRRDAALHRCSLVGYCLMSNHVHLMVVPDRADSIAQALRHTHGRYAAYLNARQGKSGHVWQGRYYSCPLDHGHLWTALRYVECNPVRAGMATLAKQYPWSSAAAHCAGAERHAFLDLDFWRAEWNGPSWQEFLSNDTGHDADAEQIRSNTHTGRPLGAEAFVRWMEQKLHRPLAPRKGGRPVKRVVEAGQQSFDFAMSE